MTVKNSKRTRRKYDTAFKEEALKMVASGRPIDVIAEAMGIGNNLIYQWRRRVNAQKSNDGAINHNVVMPQEAEREIERFRAELRRPEQERDILKKALGILGRGI